MRRNLRQKLVLLLCGLLFSLLLGEVGARLLLAVLPPPPDSYWVADPHCGYRLRHGSPGTTDPASEEYVNSLGFRDRERTVAKPPGTFRALGLGDSFVYGAVPPWQNFLQVAEAELNASLPSDSLRTDIPLLGCPGWSGENQLGLLRSLGLEMQPDLVVVNFFVGNDVTGIPVRGTVIRGDLHFRGSSRWWLHLLRRSRLFMLAEKTFLLGLRQRWVAGQFSTPDQAGTPAATDADPDSTTLPRVKPGYLLIQTRNTPVYRRQAGGRLARLWQEAEGYLADIDLTCREAGIPLLLAIVPAEIQVDPVTRQQVMTGLGLQAEDHDFDLPQRRLRAFAAERGIEVFDPLPELRAAHRPEARLYVPNDTHWSWRGNELVGRLLAQKIRELREAS